VRAFSPSLHPRGPDGRFTKSFARLADSKTKARRDKIRSGFKARPPFRSPGDAHGWLSGLSTQKSKGPGQMDRALAALREANKTLRAGKSTDGPLAGAMKPLPDDVQVFRSVSAKKFGQVAPSDLVGFHVRDAGYFPTTVAPTKPRPGEIRMRIDVPKGTKAAGSPDTSELVLDAGTEMTVDEVTTSPDGSTEMHLTALGGDAGSAPDSGDATVPDSSSGPSPAQRIVAAAAGSDALAAAPSSLVRNDGAGLPAEQRAAVEEYRGDSAYRSINAALRGASDDELAGIPLADPTDRATIDGLVANMDAAMAGSRLTADVQTFRGVGDASRMFGDRLGGDLTGMEWREDAYVSTSADRAVSDEFAGNIPPGAVMMRVLVPAGIGGIELSGESDEAELLLARGLTMRVVADNGVDDDGVRQIDVEVVPINAT
jgi:hypothetical protein